MDDLAQRMTLFQRDVVTPVVADEPFDKVAEAFSPGATDAGPPGTASLEFGRVENFRGGGAVALNASLRGRGHVGVDDELFDEPRVGVHDRQLDDGVRRDQVALRHVEFLPLSGHRVLVILVLNDREVQNRVIHTERAYEESELNQAANFINREFGGLSLMKVREALLDSMQAEWEARGYRHFTRLGDPSSLAEHIGSNAYVGALHDTGCGHLQPLKYLHGLARAAQAMALP